VKYAVENFRVEQKTDYEKLIEIIIIIVVLAVIVFFLLYKFAPGVSEYVGKNILPFGGT